MNHSPFFKQMRKKQIATSLIFVFVVLLPLALVTGVGTAQSQEEVQISQQSEFEVSDFQAPSQSNARMEIRARATIRNTGDTRERVPVQYRISERVVATRTVGIEPGEITTVSLVGLVPTLSAGTHQQGIFIGDTEIGQTSSIVLGPQPAILSVTRMQPSADEGTVGSRVSATATITNRGDMRGIRSIEYRIKNVRVARQVVTLEPGENRTITLRGSVPPRVPGSYTQGVYIGSSNNGLTSTFRIASTGASFGVRSLIAPSSATGGDQVTARVTVTNTGGTGGTRTIYYRIDGETVATQDVTLDFGEREVVRLQGTVPERNQGTYEQRVFVGGRVGGVSSNIVITPAGSATFTVSDMRAATQVQEDRNATVLVTANVENVGERRGSKRVEYRVNDTVLDSQTVELRAGESTTVRFEATLPDMGIGTYQQGVFVEDTNRGQTSSLRITSQPLVTVTGFRAPFSATAGSPVSVSATVRNSDDQRRTHTVEYRVGETVIASENMSVEAVSSRTVVLRGTVPSVEAGTYQQSVLIEGEGLRKNLLVRELNETSDDGVEEEGDEETEDETQEETTEDGSEGMPGFTVTVGVLALLLVAAVSRFKQR